MKKSEHDLLIEARTLIKVRKFNEAKIILKSMPNNETARNWLRKLDESKPKRSLGRAPIIITLLMIASIIAVLFIVINRNSTSNLTELPTDDIPAIAALSLTSPPMSSPTNSPSPSSTLLPSTTFTHTLIPSTTFTETFVPTVTPTLTETPSKTSTITPSATNTRRPPLTPRPTIVYGTRNHPWIREHEIQDGNLSVLLIFTNADDADEFGEFNPEPQLDEMWVLVAVEFTCTLPSDEICDLDDIRFELTGSLGRIYERERFIDLEDEFEGTVFGGTDGQLGLIAFLADKNDDDFLLIVNEFEERHFFWAVQSDMDDLQN